MSNNKFPSFDLIESFGHEQVVFCSNKELGLKAHIHNSKKKLT